MMEPLPIVKIFYCNAREDIALRDELEKHLSPLRRLNQATTWYDHNILAGSDRAHEIDTHLSIADIILLLVSPDFIHSDNCYEIMQQSLERSSREGGSGPYIVPIILRPVHWKETPIGKLEALPTEGKPVTQWTDRDLAFFDVVRGVRRVVAQVYWTQAAALYYRARYEEALLGFEQIIATDPNDIHLIKCKASLLWHLGFSERAEALWRQLIATDPNDYGSRSMLGMVLFSQGREEESEEYFGEVTE